MTLHQLRPVLAALLLLPAGCKPPLPPREFDGASAFKYIERQMAFGPRIPGTAGHQRMAAWLDSILPGRADSLIVQRWKHVTARGDTLTLTNYLLRFNPSATEHILYLAHWDTRPTSDSPLQKAEQLAANRARPVPGANDGASGVALLLGIADVLKRTPPGRGIDLLLVDGEDYGDFEKTPDDVLMGSKYYAANLPPGPTPLFAVLWDMIAGKNLQLYQEGNSLLGAPEVVELVWTAAKEAGHGDVFVASPKYTLIDDHVSLQKVGIRAIDVVHFAPDYPYWHTPDDTIDKLSSESLQIVGDVAIYLARH
ncbi:MAG TPA: M28 family peptidase [Gemmatimonadales bacterium]|nr:M28 family peptidase [Gemmatimonadales bacterium]